MRNESVLVPQYSRKSAWKPVWLYIPPIAFLKKEKSIDLSEEHLFLSMNGWECNNLTGQQPL